MASYPESLLEPAVVGDVLSLRHPAVDVEVDLLHGVARVLVHDALRRTAERRDRPVVPPLLQVPVLVELPPCDEMY